VLSPKLKFLLFYFLNALWWKILFLLKYLFLVLKNLRKLDTFLYFLLIFLFLIRNFYIVAAHYAFLLIFILDFNLVLTVFIFEKIFFVWFVDVIIVYLKFNIVIFISLVLIICSIFLLRTIIWIHIFYCWKSACFFYLIFIFLNYIYSFLS